MKVTMYHDKDEWWLYGGEIPSIMCLMCSDQKINIEHIIDKETVLRIVKGNYQPYRDNQVIVTNDGTVIKDYFDFVKWIDAKGLRLC